VLLAEKEGF